jgi:hypothetical protein
MSGFPVEAQSAPDAATVVVIANPKGGRRQAPTGHQRRRLLRLSRGALSCWGTPTSELVSCGWVASHLQRLAFQLGRSGNLVKPPKGTTRGAGHAGWFCM